MSTILVIDDQAANRDLLNALLTSRGYRILEAVDGIQGLKAAREGRPDLILTDIVMPHMNGFQLAQELLLYPETADIPVIFVSAHAVSDRTEVMAASYGVKYVFRVPIEPEVIFKAVEVVLKRTKAESEPS